MTLFCHLSAYRYIVHDRGFFMQNSVLHSSETTRKGSIDLERAQGASKSIYDRAVLTDRPTLYLPLPNNESWEFDFANTGAKGRLS
jgi:hypothetical protein